jgi:hypothetical protein
MIYDWGVVCLTTKKIFTLKKQIIRIIISAKLQIQVEASLKEIRDFTSPIQIHIFNN